MVDPPESALTTKPELLLPYPDYTRYAINSPERIEAMSILFKGSKTISTLEEDLALSSQEPDLESNPDQDDKSEHSTPDNDSASSEQDNHELDTTYEYLLYSNSDSDDRVPIEQSIMLPQGRSNEISYHSTQDNNSHNFEGPNGMRFRIVTTEVNTVTTTYTTARETTCKLY